MLLVVSNLHAQQNELPVTTMITSKAVGDTFSLIIEVNDPKGGSVEGLEGTAEEGVYQITSQIIRIYGDLTLLNCARNQLTSLDVSQLTYIIGLYCSQNRLSALDIGKLTNLSSLYCFNNLFTTEAIEEIIQALPDQSYLSDILRGEFVPMSSQQSDQTIELSVEMLSQLSDKGWDAYDGASDNPIGVVPLILPDEVTISDLTATTHGHKLSNPTQVFIGEGVTIHYSLESNAERWSA